MTTPPQVSFVTITEDQAGQRIDNFLLTYLKGVPKSHIYRILRTGEVRANKGRIKQTYRLVEGDIIRVPPVQVSETVHTDPPKSAVEVLKNAILYEDGGLLIINKPSGMAVHGGSGLSFGVIEGLRALFPNLPNLELVHRLDRDTSGCLMISKKSSVLRQLHEQLREGTMRKSYLALVQGYWEARVREVNAPLKKNILQSGERVVRVNVEGKSAITKFQVLQRFADATLVKAMPVTGRTHQIRVHATHAQHPIAGDDKYGNEDFDRKLRPYGLKRLFLHAAELQVSVGGKAIEVTAPLPAELQQLLEKLEP
ncbi:MAG: rRNA pseudouridine synthase RluC [Pseudomonadota bacterium]|jgi:23S rRNA pseudouridine955/2504/2580 synthase